MNYFYSFSLLVVVLCICHSNSHDENVEVSAPVGRIKGSFMTTRLGKNIYAFRGVRYAEPPVGENRFKSPIPVNIWSDVFDASEEGPSCIRPTSLPVSEDCLRLNIYTTKLPTTSSSKGGHRQDVKRPVIVFFHPGGFYQFSAQTAEFGPQYLLDKDVVLVTVNYRLGTLGFISTGDALAPGNLGLKDQVIALRWIQTNIVTFGGDPNSVTITGYSAGSWSVILHMLSPMSSGLFHRVIASSAAPTKQESLPTHQKHLVTKQARLLGCPTDTIVNSVNCLKTKPAEEFSKSLSKMFDFYGDPILLWSVVVEPEIPGVERFLPGKPEDLIREGRFQHVPVITGITKDEFSGVIVYVLAEIAKGNFTIFNQFNSEWNRIAPISFLYQRDTHRSLEISKKLKEFYLNNQPLTEDNIIGLAHLYADAVTIFSVHRFVNLISAFSTQPVYYYNFAYQGRYSFSYYPNSTEPYGVVHHDDLQYIFQIRATPHLKTGDPEIIEVERLTSMYEHFAKTGEPIPKHNNLFNGVVWNRFTPENKAYLEFGNDTHIMKTGLYQNRMNFWERLFPLPPLSKSNQQ